MIRSLRAQLALWHGALLAITLILLATITYIVLRQVLSSLADAVLQDYAEKTARNIAVSLYQAETIANGKISPEERQRLERTFVDTTSWGRFVQVDDPRGLPVALSDALRSTHFPDRPEPRYQLLTQQTRVTFETLTDPSPMRIVTVPVEMGKHIPYLVRVGAPAEGVDEAIKRVSTLLLVLTPSIFLIALAGGWILVGRALKPVDEMTRAALSIERKRMDVRVVPPRTDNEIGRLASALNEMIARLDRSFRQVERFTADASHELKTPLTTIRGEAEVALMSEMTPAQYRETLVSIIEETDRLTEIVSNLLLLSRADADQVRLKQEPVELDEVAMQSFETVEQLARRKHITLDIGEMEAINLPGDALWLQQLITNLLHNAINYTPEGGRVTLSLQAEDPPARAEQPPADASRQEQPVARRREAVLRVADTGPGIPAEHLPHIFDRFYRVDSGRSRDQGGSGLGLNIARWIAESHDGSIAAESVLGQGSTFVVRLPLPPAD